MTLYLRYIIDKPTIILSSLEPMNINNKIFIRTAVYILTELKLRIKRSVRPYIFDIVDKPTIILSSLEHMNIHFNNILEPGKDIKKSRLFFYFFIPLIVTFGRSWRFK